MKVLFEDCSVKEKLLDITLETEETLTRLCENEYICGFLDVTPKSTGHIRSMYFEQIGNHFIYLPAFYIPRTSGITKLYFMKSIAYEENSVVEGSQYHFSDKGKLQKPVAEKYETVYLEGVFGFKLINEKCSAIEKGYIKVILCSDGSTYRLDYNNKTNKVTIMPQLPPRCLLENYLNTITRISSMIRPKGMGIEIPFSATVRKEIH